MKFLRLTVFLCSVVVLFHLQSCEPEADPVAAKATHLYFSDFSGKRIVAFPDLDAKTAPGDADAAEEVAKLAAE